MPKYNDLASCLFFDPVLSDLFIRYFVYEPYPFDCEADETRDVPHLFFVADGTGIFTLKGNSFHLKKNDFFFLPPHTPFSYRKTGELRLYYIAFSGPESKDLISAFPVTEEAPVYTPATDFTPLWETYFLRVTKSTSPLSDRMAKALLYELTYRFSEETGKGQRPAERDEPSLGDAVLSYVNAHFSDPDLSLKKISRLFHFSYSYLSQVFMKKTGTALQNHVNNLRLARAEELLKTTDEEIKSIAIKVGFRDPLYFSRAFKVRTGKSPSEFRKFKKNAKDPLFRNFYVLD